MALIGYAWVKSGVDYPVPFVTTLVINVGLPALLFYTLATSTVELSSLLDIALGAVVVHAIAIPIAVGLLRAAGKDWRLSVAHVVGNTGNLGLSLCLLAFGEEGLAYAMAFFAVQCLLMFSIGDAIYAGRFSIKAMFTSPVFPSILAGVAVRWFDIPIPELIMDTTALLSGLVIPIMLITLGVSLSTLRVDQMPTVLLWSFIRTAMAIAVGFFVAELLQLEGIVRGVLIVEATVPVAVFNFLLAQKHGRDSSEVAGLILVTHLAALVYLPFILYLVLP